jgi:hypothetical protein
LKTGAKLHHRCYADAQLHPSLLTRTCCMASWLPPKIAVAPATSRRLLGGATIVWQIKFHRPPTNQQQKIASEKKEKKFGVVSSFSYNTNKLKTSTQCNKILSKYV